MIHRREFSHNEKLEAQRDMIKRYHSSFSESCLISFGSFLIDSALFRVKDPKVRRWLERFLGENSDELEIKVLVRTNPYKTLQILWSKYFRIALKGHNLKTFLQIIDKLEELRYSKDDECYMRKGVRVIPLAPAWIPENRVLIDLILEYLAGRIPEEEARRVFYSAFLRIFKENNPQKLPNSLT
ncbi:MAG: hypothetical protein ACTSVA_09600 [Candidatus Njordarchaeales archaeon]